jgi:hypothetical protein
VDQGDGERSRHDRPLYQYRMGRRLRDHRQQVPTRLMRGFHRPFLGLGLCVSEDLETYYITTSSVSHHSINSSPHAVKLTQPPNPPAPPGSFALGGILAGCWIVLVPSSRRLELGMYTFRLSLASLWKVGLKKGWWKYRSYVFRS